MQLSKYERMKIANQPQAYQGAYPEVTYTLTEAIPDEVTEVEILGPDTSAVTGTKRMSGSSQYEVNIAGYVQRQLNIWPATETVCGIYPAPGRMATARIRVGSLTSQAVPVSGGTVRAETGHALTDKPDGGTLGRRDIEEVAFVAPGQSVTARITLGGSSTHQIALPSITCDDGMYVVLIAMQDIENRLAEAGKGPVTAYRTLTLGITAGSLGPLNRRYRIVDRSGNSTRLAWVNRYGAIDAFTFEHIGTELITAKKQRVCTRNGYEVLGSEAETETALHVAAGCAAQMRWLGGLIASPAVWRLEANGWEAVDVITDTLAVREEPLQGCEIRIRPRRRTLMQNR